MLDLDRLAAALTGSQDGIVRGDLARQEVSDLLEPRIRELMERDDVTRMEAVRRMMRARSLGLEGAPAPKPPDEVHKGG